MSKFCRYCGTQLAENAAFCKNCGRRVPREGAMRMTAASKPYYCRECGALIPAGTKFCRYCGFRIEDQDTAAGKRPKKSGKKTLTAAVCVTLSAVLAFTGLVKPGFLLPKKESGGSSGTVAAGKESGASGSGLTGGSSKTEVLPVSAENLTAKSETGVRVELSPFLFDYDEERELSIRQAGVEKAENGDWQVTAYDFDFEGMHDLDTFVDIRIPYEGTFCEKGEDPSKCVGAKYYSEETGEWEDVLFDVDAEAKEVVIHTDHFSRFGCFEVKNEGYRSAYIAGINEIWIDDYDIPLNEAKAALAEYAAGGGPGEKCYKLGELPLKDIYNEVLLSPANKFNDIVGSTGTALSLSDLFFFTKKYAELNENFWDKMGTAGFLLGGINVVSQVVRRDRTDAETASMLKDMGLWLLGGTADIMDMGNLGIALVGVTLLDKAIQSFGEAAKGYRVERINNIYVYYNDLYQTKDYHARTSREWRDVVARCVKESDGDDKEFKRLLEDEIDTYARAFFNGPIDTESWNIQADFAEHFSGARVGVITKDEAESLIQNYKERMYQRLSGAILKEQQKDYELRVRKQYLKTLKDIQKGLNEEVQFHIYEDMEGKKEPELGGYILRFAPLSSYATDKQRIPYWTAKLPKDGKANTKMTVVSYIFAGLPDRLDVYEPTADPDKDKPSFSCPFEFSYPTTEVVLTGDFDIYGTWEIQSDMQEFSMPMLDSYARQQGQILGSQGNDYLSQYYGAESQYANAVTKGTMVLRPGSDEGIVKATVQFEEGPEQYYEGRYDKDARELTLDPKDTGTQQTADGYSYNPADFGLAASLTLRFLTERDPGKPDQPAMRFEGETSLDNSMVKMRALLSGTKISDDY